MATAVATAKKPGLVLLGVVDELDDFLRGKGWADGAKRELEERDGPRRHVEIRRLAHTALLAAGEIAGEEARAYGEQVQRANLNGENTGATRQCRVVTVRQAGEHRDATG